MSGVAEYCPALRQLRRCDSACFAHILGAVGREEIRVCRESCTYGRALAQSAGVPGAGLSEFVPLEVACEQESPAVHVGSVCLPSGEMLGQLLRVSQARSGEPAPVPVPVSSGEGQLKYGPPVPVTCEPVPRKRGPGRPRGSKNDVKPLSAPVPAPVPRVPAFLVVPALASAVATYPARMKRARTSILRKRYNSAAGPGRKYHSYNDFLRDLNIAGVRVERDKYRVQDSWVMLDDAMRRLISTKQKRAA